MKKSSITSKNMLLEGINFATKQPEGKDPVKNRLMITGLERHTDRELSRA